MTTKAVPKRISAAILNSLRAGVVPSIGLEHIAVGRIKEVKAIVDDLRTISHGGGAFRIASGDYGSGKTFLLQLIRTNAMKENFVVTGVDLGPDRRLVGSQGEALATYRELMKNVATNGCKEGGALPVILESWISRVQHAVVQEGADPDDPEFNRRVHRKITDTVREMEGLVHGFDFARVIGSYWEGHHTDRDDLKESALKWLRGEYHTKTDAKRDLRVSTIISDKDWYDYVKLMAQFVRQLGYKGLVVVIDEVVNLFKLSHKISRERNYEKVLALFNDTMQGRASYLGFVLGCTGETVTDSRRGFYSYDALKSRLSQSQFARQGLQNMSSPVMPLVPLSHSELFYLLQKLRHIYESMHKQTELISDDGIQQFMRCILDQLGAADFLTPRSVVKDYIQILDLLRDNPEIRLSALLDGTNFTASAPDRDPHVDERFADFSL